MMMWMAPAPNGVTLRHTSGIKICIAEPDAKLAAQFFLAKPSLEFVQNLDNLSSLKNFVYIAWSRTN